MSWSIGLYSKFSFSFWKSEDWLTCYFVFQFFKCLLLFFSPFSLFIAFEFVKRFCHMTEILDKLSVENLQIPESFLFLDYLDFISFHSYLFFSYNYSQNRYFLHVKVTFWLFKTKNVFFCDFEKLDCPLFKFLRIFCQYYKIIHVVC